MTREWRLLRRGTVAALAVRAAMIVTGLAATMLVARLLPRDELGAYYIVLQTASFGVVFSLCGTSVVLQRFVPAALSRKSWRAVRCVLYRVTGIFAIGFTLFACIVIVGWSRVAALLNTPALIPLWGAALAFTLAAAIEEAVSAFFCSVERVRLGVFLHGLPKQILFLAALPLLLVSGSASLPAVAWLRAGTAGAAAVLSILLLKREMTRHSVDGPVAEVPSRGTLAWIAAPMALHLLACNLLGSVDLWCVGFFCGGDATGLYGSIMRLALLMGVIVNAINAVLPALVARLHADGERQGMETFLRRAATIGGWVAVVQFLLYVAFGRELIGLVFGAGFEEGYLLLLLLSFGHCVHAWTGSAGWVMQMTGHQSVLFRITLAGLLVNLALNLAVVRVWGPIGVAGVTCLSLVGQSIARMVLVRRLIGVRTEAFFNPLRPFRGLGHEAA